VIPMPLAIAGMYIFSASVIGRRSTAFALLVNACIMNALFNPTAVIVYHNVTYYGYFVNFDIDENQEQPWTRNYSFTFKYTDMIDTMDIVSRTSLGITSAVNKTFNGSLGGLSTAINNNLNPLSNI